MTSTKRRTKTPNVSYQYVIAGASSAGATAAHTLRLLDPNASILLLGQEARVPYHRPPLSKLTSSHGKLILPEVIPSAQYATLKIDLWLETEAIGLNPDQHVLQVRSPKGEQSIGYQKLLIATGARPTPLATLTRNLPGVHYLRTYDDACALFEDAQHAKRAVVIGGGFIGLEIASSLQQRGLDVVILERQELLYKLNHPKISRHFEALLKQHGVQCRIGQQPTAFEGLTHVTAVLTDAGERLDCDLVVIGAGVTPNTEWLRESGLKLNDGVLLNEFLQTSHPDIYAAGDIACAWHPVFRQPIRTEHIDNAVKQARCAARNMAGAQEPYARVSYFYSHVFDQSYNALGLTPSHARKIDRGDLTQPPFEVLYLEKGICQGFLTFGKANANTRAAETLIRDRINLTRHIGKLRQIDFALRDIPGQVVFVLQGGGAYGAFECGAIKALQEHKILPDVVAGVSIGAFNAAIIASAREHAAQALESFWQDISTLSPPITDESSRRMLASNQISMFGVPGFFSPRWMQSLRWGATTPDKWTSLYDFSEAKDLLNQYVDFGSLQQSPVRLLVTAVDVQTSEVVLFDSHVDHLTADHILASGSLPPAFDWTTINGRHYWDAGIISNSPLESVLGRLGSTGKQIYLIDLFTGRREHLPANMLDVYSRREEIIFSERLRHDHGLQDQLQSHRKLIDMLMSELPDLIADRYRSEPLYQQLMGQTAATTFTRIMRETTPQNPPSRAYDFSRSTVLQLIEDGYNTAQDVLNKRTK